MELPLSVLLLPYGLVVALGALLLFFNLYHLAKFGLEGGKTMSLMSLYGLGFLFCFVISFDVLFLTDWNATFGLQDIFPFFSLTTF